MTDAASEWIRQEEAGSIHLIRLMRWLALNAPGAVTDPVISGIATWYSTWPGFPAAQASRRFLTHVLGREPRWSERHRHIETFAHVILERVHLLSDGVDRFRVEATGQETIADLHQLGRGGVLLGAHYGSFEALRAFDRSLPGLKVRYLMYPDNAGKTNQVLGELNPDLASRVISLAHGPDAMLAVFEVLERGEFVGFLGDRVPSAQAKARVRVRFLDRWIEVPNSPYIAAMAAGVPLILCFAPRLGRHHYAAEFSMLYDGTPVPRRARDAKVAELAQAYATALELHCRRDPYNWFNFFDIWRD
ncbi:MAG: hypothetical protein AAGI70_14010 [Pseudomonadota bacterium]